MQDKSKIIFGNQISAKDYRKALNSKKKYLKKYGDDRNAQYTAKLVENAVLHAPLGVLDIRVGATVRRASSSATSAWASVTTAYPSRWRQPLMLWATRPTGWI